MGVKISRRLDLLGFLCPIPVHETRRALGEMNDGEVIEVICDDPETLHDIPALCERLGFLLDSAEEDSGIYKFTIAKVTGDL